VNAPRWLYACAVAACLAGWSGPPQAAASARTFEAPAVPEAAIPSLPASSACSVTLSVALEAAWQRAVVARASAGQIRRAEADQAVADSLWAAPPALHFSHRDDQLQNNGGRRETELGVTLPLWLSGQRDARAGVADAATAQAQGGERAARLRLAGELRETAWQLNAVQAETAQIEAQVAALARLANDVERRVRAGELARADLLAAQAEHLAASALLTDARQRLRVALARWTLLTGLSAVPELTLTPTPLAAEGSPTPHPELLLASESTELAQRRVELMRRTRRDPPEVTVGVRRERDGRIEPAQGGVLVNLRLPFGNAARNRPLEAAAFAELDVAETQELRLRERLESDIASARDAERAAEVQLEAETVRARLLRERSTLIHKSFHVGEMSLPDLLRALAAAALAETTVARQTAALGLARARLQQALGVLP